MGMTVSHDQSIALNAIRKKIMSYSNSKKHFTTT